jgi:hypothetical protein
MIGNYFARLTGSKRNLLALLASSVVFTAGCANMSSSMAPSSNPFSSPASLSGNVHGGNQPVVGATVSLWFIGQGSFPATKGATTTTDASGAFNFTKDTSGGTHDGTTSTYACPTTVGSSLVYVISQGGNTQNNGVVGQTNTAATFIALYGDCASINASNFVYMSEVTTVATMAAVQQFFNPVNDTLTADSTGQQRLIVLNLPSTVALLANTTTGLANAATAIPALPGANVAPTVSLTVTPETSKVNTLANIVSACVNGATAAAPACGTLFASAQPPVPNLTNLNPGSFPAATDTLQALFYMFTNPTNGSTANMTALFGLQPAVGAPYVPALATQPNDWTVGISYASTGTGNNCASGNFISSPVDINIDGSDNVWFANSQTGGNLSAISSTGAPLACVHLDAGASQGGGVLDSLGNVWFGAGTTLYRYNPNTQVSLTFPVGVAPLGITADGLGSVYFSTVAGTTGSVYAIFGAAGTPVPVAPTQISNSVGPNPIRLMPDFKSTSALGNIWVSSGTTFISQISASSAVGNLNGFVTTPFTTSGNSYGLTVGRGGIFTSAIDTGAITQLVNNGTTYPVASGFPLSGSTVTAAGINAPTAISLDGRSNTWIPNNGNGISTGSVSEISVFGGPITPSTGYQKASSYLNSGRASIVDQAGNVWIVGDGNTFVTEIVGGGVPIYQPYAIGLSNGRFQSIP